jgi:heavy metal sensor kinase
MFDSVRVRLTVWYVGVLAVVLVGFSVVLYVMVARSLYEELDDDLHLALEAVTVRLSRDLADNKSERQAALDAVNEVTTRRADGAAIYDAAGKLLAEQPEQGDARPRLPAGASVSAEDIFYATMTHRAGGSTVSRRVAARRVHLDENGADYLLIVNESFDPLEGGLGAIRDLLYIAIPGALLISGLGGWFLTRQSLAPVVSMSERARRISAENLEQRLPVINPRDELGRLAATFNELLSRLDESFSYQRRFMADASHELRTPLSVMRTATGVTLEREGRTEIEYRDALKIIDEQARRLSHIVEDMFTLARSDVGRQGLRQSDFYLDELIMEVARAGEVLASRKGVEISVAPAVETPFHGDEGLLRQMLLNLLDNSVKHTPAGGSVSVRLERENGHHAITVSDTGAGIPPEAQSKIFERFYRVDKARSRAEAAQGAMSGAGLGLSIARWIAEAHGGQLVLKSSGETGSTFVASLPVNCEF